MSGDYILFIANALINIYYLTPIIFSASQGGPQKFLNNFTSYKYRTIFQAASSSMIEDARDEAFSPARYIVIKIARRINLIAI